MMIAFLKRVLILSNKFLLSRRKETMFTKMVKFQVDPTVEQMERCAQLAKSFYNFTVTVEDFAMLMQSAENYRFLYSTLAMSFFL